MNALHRDRIEGVSQGSAKVLREATGLATEDEQERKESGLNM